MRPMLVLVMLFLLLAGGCQQNRPPVEISMSRYAILLRSTSNKTLKNLRLTGAGFDEMVVTSLEPGQSCELQLYQGKTRWEPRDGDTVEVSGDDFPKPITIEIEIKPR